MAFLRKIKAGLVKTDITTFIGEEGNIFFNVETGELRYSDGITPGGLDLHASVLISGTQPTSPNQGDTWFNSTTDELNIYVNGVWTPVSGSGGALPSETEPQNANEGDLWYKQSTNELNIYINGWSAITGGSGNGPRGYTGSQGIGFTGS